MLQLYSRLSLIQPFRHRARPCASIRVHAVQCAPMRLLVQPVQIGDLKLCKELKEKLLGSDREGLRLGIIDRQSEPDRRSEAISFGAG